MSATALAPHVFWLTSRAAGSAAMLLSSVSVSVGLLMGGRLIKGRAPDLRVTHEALSIATILAIVVHAGALLGDSYLQPSIADVTLPLLSSYKTVWTTLGIVAGWATILLGLSYYMRARIGVERWRMLHRFTALAWILGVTHAIGEGTDAGQAWFLIATAIVVVPGLVLLTVRLVGRGPRTGRPATP